MKTYSIKEFKAIQDEQQYKYIALHDQSGSQIINFNSNRIPSAQRLREIETRFLTKGGLKDGYYLIKCKNTTVKTAGTDDYLILKGSASNLSEPEPTTIKIVESVAPNLLTYENALKLNVEVQSLKLENAALKKEIELLKADLEESNETLSESDQPTLMENANTFLSNAMGFIAPLIDKHFDLKEKALGLKAVELELKMGSMKKPSPEQKPTLTDQQKIEAFIMAQQEDVEIYEKLAVLYNTAENVEDFLKQLNEYNEDLFKTLTNGR
jgi:hypothetical protein